MGELNLKERLEIECEYAMDKYKKTSKDIEIMLDGLNKECFEPVCNIELLREIQDSYFGLALHLKRAIIDINKTENGR
jgi:hypothetical protein